MKCLKIFLSIAFLCLAVLTAAAEEPKKFELTSPAFKNGEAISDPFTCRATDKRPQFNIANIPEKTKSLAMIVDDPDAPEGTWVHWIVYNIPPETTEIAPNAAIGIEGLNDFGAYHYRGPCPQNKKLHHYSFRLYALDRELDELNEGFIKQDLERAMKGKILAQAELIGTYKNK